MIKQQPKLAEPINNIEMCHAQGKPAVNWGDKEHTVIASHWPNGVVDRLTVAHRPGDAHLARWEARELSA